MRLADATPASPITGNDRTETDLLRHFFELDLTGRRAIVAAVSGGSDSTALLLLTKAWLDTVDPAVDLIAVTVDHGLRPESAHEAQQVARLCTHHGITHRIVCWDGEKPASGLSAAARAARYRLLAEEAQAAGADIILTGHTLDDQVETVSMRQARGEGRGLAGMASATLFDGAIWIVRPLLALRREALRGFLRRQGASWINDPTNVDPRYERARVRAGLTGDDDERLLSKIADAQRRRIALGAEAAAIIAGEAARVAPGLIRLAPQFAKTQPAEAAAYAFRVLLGVTGGMAHLPDEERSAALVECLQNLPLRATLSRSVVDARPQGIFLRREVRGLPGPETPLDGMLWDRKIPLEMLRSLGGPQDRAIRDRECPKDGGDRCRATAKPCAAGTCGRTRALVRRGLPGADVRSERAHSGCRGDARCRAMGAVPAFLRFCAGALAFGTARQRNCSPPAIQEPQ